MSGSPESTPMKIVAQFAAFMAFTRFGLIVVGYPKQYQGRLTSLRYASQNSSTQCGLVVKLSSWIDTKLTSYFARFCLNSAMTLGIERLRRKPPFPLKFWRCWGLF